MIRFFDSCSWISMTFSWPFTIKYPPANYSQGIMIVMTDWYNLFSLCVFFFCIPGSSGHSLSFANSMGVFPVSTQLELRNIIGILQKPNTIKHITIRNKHWIKWQDHFKNHVKAKPKHIFYLPIGSALRMILWLPRVYSMSTVMGAE